MLNFCTIYVDCCEIWFRPSKTEIIVHCLHLLVQGEDLFTSEANFHQSCYKSINLKYINNLHDTAQSTNFAIDTEQIIRLMLI